MPWGAIIGGAVKVVEVLFRKKQMKPPEGVDENDKGQTGPAKEDAAVLLITNLLFQLDDTMFGDKIDTQDEAYIRMGIKSAVYFLNKKHGHTWD